MPSQAAKGHADGGADGSEEERGKFVCKGRCGVNQIILSDLEILPLPRPTSIITRGSHLQLAGYIFPHDASGPFEQWIP